jgi:hypothetical protein
MFVMCPLVQNIIEGQSHPYLLLFFPYYYYWELLQYITAFIELYN